METEYAYFSNVDEAPPLDFGQFMAGVRQIVPSISSSQNPHRFFLANGGTFSIEGGSLHGVGHASLEAAFVETATPVCRSPMQLIEYQYALRDVAVEALKGMTEDGERSLVQGNHDAYGHTYGQHESYDVNVAKGFCLFGWRAFLVMMLPALLLYHGLTSLWLMTIWIVASVYLRIRKFFSRKKQGGAQPSLSTRWLTLCTFGVRLFHTPIVIMLWCNIRLFALRPYRKMLKSFFATRCVVDGAGYIDEAGRFWVSARSAQTNCVIGFGSYGRSRPIFRCDSWLRELCIGPGFSWKRYRGMFANRRRVEIAIGDSGLCDLSQYLKVGITSLVLDLAERNPDALVPRLCHPIRALNAFAKDWMLLARVPDKNDCHWRACDVQNSFASAVRKMLEEASKAPDEAWRIMEQWQFVLNHLESSDDKSEPPRLLVGRIDWITKLWILEHLKKENASVDAKRKLDLRYHELSSHGYFRRVMDVVDIPRVISRRGLERARGNPPVDDPVSIARSYLIREFSNSGSQLEMDRDSAQWYSNGQLRRVRFS
ncbi:MAG: proteasome accessory factor PafA2 family protein [Pirellula sp.]